MTNLLNGNSLEKIVVLFVFVVKKLNWKLNNLSWTLYIKKSTIALKVKKNIFYRRVTVLITSFYFYNYLIFWVQITKLRLKRQQLYN